MHMHAMSNTDIATSKLATAMLFHDAKHMLINALLNNVAV